MSKLIYPCLWFDGQALPAAEFYCSIHPNSKVLSANPMAVVFELNGAKFMALNGGPEFHFSEATSFVITCETQEEIDHYWDKLTEGGSEGKCGWLKDKFGISWQVTAPEMSQYLGGADSEGAQRATKAMLEMKKINSAAMKRAYLGES